MREDTRKACDAIAFMLKRGANPRQLYHPAICPTDLLAAMDCQGIQLALSTTSMSGAIHLLAEPVYGGKTEKKTETTTMNDPAQQSVPRYPRTVVLAVAALLTVGLLLRLTAMGRDGLWVDEIFSASYTNLSLFETVVACMRFDVHPPLYYLQLNLWSILGHGDTWLMLNSVLWGMVSLVLVFIITARRFATRAALMALACCVVMGSEVYFANELRPYTCLGALMLSSWIAASRLLADYRFRTGIPLILVLIAVGGAHSFGPIAVSAALLYVFPHGDSRKIKRDLPTWIAISSIVGLATLPWMINASMRRVGHMSEVTPAVIAHTVSGWALGYGGLEVSPAVRAAVAVVTALIMLLGALRIPSLRRMIVCYMLWPIAFTAVASLLWKPIWLFRPFAYCAPLLAIVLGALVSELFSQVEQLKSPVALRVAGGLSLVTLLALGSLSYEQSITPWKTQYRTAATYLREHVQSSDLIYVPNHIAFWGIARYLIGPQWGTLLQVQDPLDQDHSQQWPHIYQRLGARNLERLHLLPSTRHLDGFSAPMYVGWSPLPEAQSAESVWIVGPGDARPDDFTLEDVSVCPYKVLGTVDFASLRVFHIACAAHGAAPLDASPTSVAADTVKLEQR